jgi:integrase
MVAQPPGGHVMAGYHLYKPTNGSGKTSRFFSASFTVAGKLIRRATGERDRGRADVRAAALYLEAHQRARVPISAPGFDQLGDRQLAQVAALFLDDLKSRIESNEFSRAESYYDDAERDLRCHILASFKRIDEITTKKWDEAAKAWHASGLKWRSVQRLTITARHVLRFASGLGVLPSVPEIRAPKREQVIAEQATRRSLSKTELTKFLAEVKKISPRAWRIYTVLFWSAMRRSDLRRLTLAQINWSTGYIDFPAGKTKSKKEGQQIWMHPKVVAALKAEIAALEKGTKKKPGKKLERDQPLFPQFTVERTGKKAMIAAKLDLKGLTAHHTTRHTTATLAGDAGASLAELMALGRWSSPQMAMRYMHENAKRSKAALEKL